MPKEKFRGYIFYNLLYFIWLDIKIFLGDVTLRRILNHAGCGIIHNLIQKFMENSVMYYNH